MWSDGGGVGLHFFRSQSGKSRCLVQATGLTFTTRYRLYAFGMFTCLCSFRHVIGVRGSLEWGYFVLACVWSGRWADFEGCSRIGACAFQCFFGNRSIWLTRNDTFEEKKHLASARLYFLRKSSMWLQ